jgi:4-amino-4-deoxy-L-arabinose transferase-like glycosyltransferase
MSKKVVFILLSLIVLLAAILRFTLLDKYPPGVTGDEIQQGYSAYSLLKTGMDEWGDRFPLFPISFGDYRPPVYIYLTVPFVALFDLNILSTRLASALFGTLSILLMFFLSQKLFKNLKIALLSSFILAISSWHVFYSRAAWESNVGLFFFLCAVWLFLKGIEKPKWFILSALSFGLTIFSYYSYKLFIPIFVIGLVFIYRKQLKKIPGKELFAPLVIALVFVGILAYGELFTGSGRRAADAAIYNQENIAPLRDIQVDDPLPQPWGRVVNNKIAYLTTQFAQNYLGYFSTTFLTSPNRSDSSLYNLPGQWLIGLWELLFILIGIFFMNKAPQNSSRLLILWALASPIPAALTRNYMHTQRVEVLLALTPIIAAFGMYSIYHYLKRSHTRLIISAVIGGVILYSIAVRVDYYLFHQFDNDLGGLHYGYNEIFKLTESKKDSYDQIIFTKVHSEPQAFLAFYSKMDPNYYQSFSKDWKDFESQGFKFIDQTNYKLGKYYFKNIEWNEDKVQKNTLIVGSDQEIPDGITPDHVIKDPFGRVLFKVVDTNKEL